jgi:ABC-type polysaccharide/polyol phosphate export permease
MTPREAVPEWTENSAAPGSSWAIAPILWRHRGLIGYLAWRDLKVRYRQATLGILWVLVQPVATVVIFTFVFDRLAGIDSDGIPYPLFALAGMVTWTYFSTAVSRGSEVLVGNPNLVTKVYFPRVVAPAAGLVSPALDMAVSMTLLAGLLVYFGVWPGLPLLAAPLWALLLLGTTLAFSLWLSALNVRYRDVRHALAPVLQLWLFASPVAYPAALLSGWTQYVYAINPMVGILELGRWSLVGGPWPGWPLAVSLASASLVLATGLVYFRRAEPTFADVI